MLYWYADANGTFSHTQTLKGLDERTATYELSNAEADELEDKGRQKFQELRNTSTIDVDIPDGIDADVGDLVTGRDNNTGLVVTAEISKKIGVSPKSIDAYMIGEHGFSQLAAFKAATIAGKNLNELQAENPDKYSFDHMEVEELARKGGYVTYQGKQCTEYAVANSAARVCAAVLHNEHAVLSASTLMTGQYGEEGIFTSLPCVIGAEGVEEVYTLDLSEHELEGFHKSCQHIRDNIAQLDWWDAEAYDAK